MPIKPKPLNRHWKPKKKAQEGRTHDNSDFYNSRKWRTHRASYLKSNPLCVHCEQQGKVTAAQVLDHIKPIRQGGDKWNTDNQQGLCSSCHNKKSGGEAHTQKG